jgi:hypothetical protein
MTEMDEIGCKRGCTEHPTRTVDIHLGGPTAYADYTPIPERFACDFTIECWDTDLMPVDHDPLWCPAHDAVSETLIALGVWEPQNTVVLMLAWEACGPETWFIDFGSQVGWFSTLAAASGLNVLAYEADAECVDMTFRNIGNVTSSDTHLQVIHERLDDGTEQLEVDGLAGMSIVAKIDIEGAEEHAIRTLGLTIDAYQVPYILMEVSPCFNDSYPELVTSLMDRGYHAYNMPPKQTPPVVIDQLSDLLPYRIVGDFGEVWDEVASWRQRDVFFALGGIEP